MINSNLSYMNLHLDGQILVSEASRLQIGAANCNQGRGAAQSNVSPLIMSQITMAGTPWHGTCRTVAHHYVHIREGLKTHSVP